MKREGQLIRENKTALINLLQGEVVKNIIMITKKFSQRNINNTIKIIKKNYQPINNNIIKIIKIKYNQKNKH